MSVSGTVGDHATPLADYPHVRDNATLRERFGIAERKGWEALNFFYNTRIDASSVRWLASGSARPPRKGAVLRPWPG